MSAYGWRFAGCGILEAEDDQKVCELNEVIGCMTDVAQLIRNVPQDVSSTTEVVVLRLV